MSLLLVGFYGEGIRDYGFLMPLIDRILSGLLRGAVDVDSYAIKLPPGLNDLEKMKQVMHEARHLHLVVYHLDADGPDEHDSYQRFASAYHQMHEEGFAHNATSVVPVIPIYMTEGVQSDLGAEQV
jgi:hypothetical protein